MLQVQKTLLDEISKLPFDKVGKVLSYVRFVLQEYGEEILLDEVEDDELDALYETGDFVDASVVEAKIKQMSND